MASIERLERMVLERITAARAARQKQCFSGEGSYSFETGLYRWSPELYRTLGLDPSDEFRQYGGLVSLCEPESALLVNALTLRYQRDGKPLDAAVLVRSGGDTRAVRITGAPIGRAAFGGVVTRWGGVISAAK